MPPHPRPDGAPARRDPAAGDPGSYAATFCATLVDEWVALGVTDAVLCPGSRNTAISVALATNERIRTQVVHDERAAGFMALGLALATGRPAVLTCTSGSAPTHFHPAVVEADLAAVPMIVATADRPPELQGVLAPQTIDQRHLYGGAVRWYCEPGPPAVGSEPWWRDLARDALERSCGVVPGPVHLNLAFREPLSGTPKELPERAPGGRPGVLGTDPLEAVTRWNVTDEELARLVPAISGRRGVVVAGARASRSDEERRVVLDFADMAGWPVLANPQSGLRTDHPAVVAFSDPVVRSGAFDGHPPEVVLRLGGLMASRPVNEWLRGSEQVPLNVAVDRYGLCPDPDSVLSMRFTVVPGELLARLSSLEPAPAPPAWTRRWRVASRAASTEITRNVAPPPGGPLDEPSTAATVMAAVPSGAELLVGSSMPVRDIESYAAPRGQVRVHSNRGTNGIDGAIATGTGLALGTGNQTVVLCGDLTFLHDVGSLNGLTGRGVDLTLVVIDNDGGGIFHFLPQAHTLDPQVFESTFGTPHGHDLVAIATGFGLPAETVHTRSGLSAALASAARRGGVKVIVVRSDRHRNVELHRSIQEGVDRAIEGAL